MSEVITEKDKEYEAREEANAPGADQAMSDRVNNRSLRPNSSAFIDFMKTGWDASEPEIEPLESSKFTPARLAALGKAFPGERLVIPAGSPKVRNNDCDYMFRPDTTFAYYTGLGQDYEAGAVLVLNPLDPDSPEAKAGKTHEAELFVAPRADTATQDFFMNAHYGEYWVGPRAGLKEMTAMTGIETHDIAQLADALSKDVGAEAGAVRVRVISDADPQVTSLVESIREANGYTDPDKNNAADDKLHEFAAEARMVKDEYEIGEMRKAVQATEHGFDRIPELKNLDMSSTGAVSSAAVDQAEKLTAKAIVAYTQPGNTVHRVSRERPAAPIYGLTTNEHTYHWLALSWGTEAFLLDEDYHDKPRKDLMAFTDKVLKKAGKVSDGDKIVVLSSAQGEHAAGSTDTIYVHTVGAND